MWNWFERTRQDVRYAVRNFGQTPGFTATVIVTLALGIGATTAMFSIVNAVLLHPLPYRNPDRLVAIWQKFARDRKAPPMFNSYRDFEVWKSRSQSFEQLAPATWAAGGQLLTGAGRAREVLAMPAGVDFFALLGVSPELGRTFERDDLNRGCTVVLKHSFWKTAFAGRRDVIGRHITLNQKACTVAGVMPQGFTFFPDALAMWTLITPDNEIARDPENAAVGVFGRLKAGVTLERAQEEVELLYKDEHRKETESTRRIPFVYPLAEQFAYLTGPNLRLSIKILFGAVSFVLLIACANIANLLLGRSLVRQKELAVRAALGSGRRRLIRQLLTEGLLLSFAGALPGVLLATAAVHYFRVSSPIEMPPGNPVRVDWYVLGFTAAMVIVTALAFGLIPALRASRVDLAEALKASGRSATSGPASLVFGKALVATEVMLSLALLAGAGLLIQSVSRLTGVALGFRTDRVYTMPLELPRWSYAKPSRRASFYREVLERAGTLPGIESVTFASSLPLNNGRYGGNALVVEGRPELAAAVATRDVAETSVTGEYFGAMGVRLESGRLFDSRDREESQAVAIVNESLVRKYFPRENPIGKQIKVGEPGSARQWLTIVGVAAVEKDRDFFHEMTWVNVPLVFRPVAQDPPFSGSIVLKATRGNAGASVAVQKLMAGIDNTVPIGEAETMNERLSRVLAYPRFRAIVLGIFAGLALLLAGVGLYGVLAQITAQRTQEFGIRIALGAERRDVLQLVLRQGMVVTAIGIVGGLAVTLVTGRVLDSLLYGVGAGDPWTLGGITVLLVAVALVAVYVPARRAARVDPMVALRNE